MDKHSKKSSSLLHYPVLVVFSLFFIGLFALDLITPDRAYSEMENTTLSQRPALTQLSAKGLNSYFTAYTKYVKDQVFGRDKWISLQSVVETTLLQKEQNGGILLGKEHMMFPRTFGLLDSENRTLPKNTAAVEALCQSTRVRWMYCWPRQHRSFTRKTCLQTRRCWTRMPISTSFPPPYRPPEGALWMCGRLLPNTRTNISTTAPTITGRALAHTTPTSSCAVRWA